MTLVDEIEKIITINIPDAKILVINTNNDGEHFEAVVISESFNNISLLKQHQAVMKPLKNEFKEKVHALGLKTFSLDKWESSKESFPLINEKIKEKYNDI